MTAKTPDGKTVFRATRIYMPQASDSRGMDMVLGPDRKLGLIRDTSIQPFAAKQENFEIDLPQDAREAVVDVTLVYQPRPGDVYPIHAHRLHVGMDKKD